MSLQAALLLLDGKHFDRWSDTKPLVVIYFYTHKTKVLEITVLNLNEVTARM